LAGKRLLLRRHVVRTHLPPRQSPILSLLDAVHAELVLVMRLLNAVRAQLLTVERAVARKLRTAAMLMRRALRLTLHSEALIPLATRPCKVLRPSTVLDARCKVRRALQSWSWETVATAAIGLGLKARAAAPAAETLKMRSAASPATEALETRRAAASAAAWRLELAASMTAAGVLSLRLAATMTAAAAMVSRLCRSRGRDR
jgi:hypothetical protein